MKRPYILVAPNGARRNKDDHPQLPMTIGEIVETAKSCFEAGADGIHAHVRGAQGQHVLDAGLYKELIAELNIHVPQMDVQITTEAVGLFTPTQQMAIVRQVEPKMVSIGLSELCAHDDKSELAAFYHEVMGAGIEVQHILYDPAELQYFEQMVDQKVIPCEAPSFLFVLGRYTAGQLSNPQHFDPFFGGFLESPFAHTGKFMTCAFGPRETTCLLHAAENGSDCRVGFENNLQMENGELATDNAARVAELVERLDRLK
ncbi:3-keto-5-aminohexanoate cleavage protein [Maritalea porphyrae]|uniref:3-keto-5-aminohexanoate cleavage protein n=1 Tax=Maritalea porphyrae TaxID=880732 RepID=UPI0022AE9F24|nr:3-keto-5-aminohexanoate cleavage protein [Maritalea porphyrae]MCZ4272510.1 3-keto-5-aminohexanoate cleavage protein [Maritalea porphyrae]